MAGVIQPLVLLLSSSNQGVQEASAAGIENLSIWCNGTWQGNTL